MNDDERHRLDQALTRLASGDRSAFDECFVLVAPVLEGFVRKAMAGTPDHEDAAQNTLLRVFGRISDYRPGTDAMAWVLTLAAFEVATLRKRAHRQQGREAGAEALVGLASAQDLEASALEHESLVRLRAAVSQLPSSDQQVLLAAAEGPRAPRERKHKQRAMERLKQLWRALNGDD